MGTSEVEDGNSGLSHQPCWWWEARRDPSASCASAKMQLFESPAFSNPVFAFPSCILKLRKASQRCTYHKYITSTNSLLCTLTLPISAYFPKDGLLKTPFEKIPSTPSPSSFRRIKSNLLPDGPLQIPD